MAKKPKWVQCPDCYEGRRGIPAEKIAAMKGVIDGCFGPSWLDAYPTCETCNGEGRVDRRAKKKATK